MPAPTIPNAGTNSSARTRLAAPANTVVTAIGFVFFAMDKPGEKMYILAKRTDSTRKGTTMAAG